MHMKMTKEQVLLLYDRTLGSIFLKLYTIKSQLNVSGPNIRLY